MKRIKLFLFFAFLVASCNTPRTPTITPTNTLTPEPTATQTPTLTPTSTPSPTATLTLTPAPTALPVSRCSPRATVKDYPEDSLPGYIDIINVSTSLDETYLTVVFTVREIPDEITINDKNVSNGWLEIRWGVAIDTDNNSETGGRVLINGSFFHGVENQIDAENYKKYPELSGPIQNLFLTQVYTKTLTPNHDSYTKTKGRIMVNQDEKTISISGNIEGISAYSYLHFYTFKQNGDKFLWDEVCRL